MTYRQTHADLQDSAHGPVAQPEAGAELMREYDILRIRWKCGGGERFVTPRFYSGFGDGSVLNRESRTELRQPVRIWTACGQQQRPLLLGDSKVWWWEGLRMQPPSKGGCCQSGR